MHVSCPMLSICCVCARDYCVRVSAVNVIVFNENETIVINIICDCACHVFFTVYFSMPAVFICSLDVEWFFLAISLNIIKPSPSCSLLNPMLNSGSIRFTLSRCPAPHHAPAACSVSHSCIHSARSNRFTFLCLSLSAHTMSSAAQKIVCGTIQILMGK